MGLAAGRACHTDDSSPLVVLATAHPAKFPSAVKAATNIQPGLPRHMSTLLDRNEKINVTEYNVETVKAFIEARV